MSVSLSDDIIKKFTTENDYIKYFNESLSYVDNPNIENTIKKIFENYSIGSLYSNLYFLPNKSNFLIINNYDLNHFKENIDIKSLKKKLEFKIDMNDKIFNVYTAIVNPLKYIHHQNLLNNKLKYINSIYGIIGLYYINLNCLNGTKKKILLLGENHNDCGFNCKDKLNINEIQNIDYTKVIENLSDILNTSELEIIKQNYKNINDLLKFENNNGLKKLTIIKTKLFLEEKYKNISVVDFIELIIDNANKINKCVNLFIEDIKKDKKINSGLNYISRNTHMNKYNNRFKMNLRVHNMEIRPIKKSIIESNKLLDYLTIYEESKNLLYFNQLPDDYSSRVILIFDFILNRNIRPIKDNILNETVLELLVFLKVRDTEHQIILKDIYKVKDILDKQYSYFLANKTEYFKEDVDVKNIIYREIMDEEYLNNPLLYLLDINIFFNLFKNLDIKDMKYKCNTQYLNLNIILAGGNHIEFLFKLIIILFENQYNEEEIIDKFKFTNNDNFNNFVDNILL